MTKIQSKNEGIWFRRVAGGILFRPTHAWGWFSIAMYFLFLLIPPIALYRFVTQPNPLLIFLLLGHIAFISMLYFCFCLLHSSSD
jgi:hypothetical protein